MTEPTNIAETLSRVLPQPITVLSILEINGQDGDAPAMEYIGLPNGYKLEAVDNEKLLAHPRRAKGSAVMAEAPSFIAFVNEFKRPGTAVWCAFNPQSAQLAFNAVIDENAPTQAGWRGMQASYTPAMSIEWMNWKGSNGSQKAMGQVEFAEFLERCNDDIAQVEGMPTSLQLQAMATEFIARSEQSIKSAIRLQDGGVNLSYVADADSGTLEAMKLFAKFAIGIPVFWTAPKLDADGHPLPMTAFRIDARLKYRIAASKVTFWYELIRPDRVHQLAAVELIEEIRNGIGDVPLRLGSFS